MLTSIESIRVIPYTADQKDPDKRLFIGSVSFLLRSEDRTSITINRAQITLFLNPDVKNGQTVVISLPQVPWIDKSGNTQYANVVTVDRKTYVSIQNGVGKSPEVTGAVLDAVELQQERAAA